MQREGLLGRVLVLDLDVHQGNGTASIFRSDADVFTFSMHGRKNFPFIKEQSSLDIELEDGCDDAGYLSLLEAHLAPALDTFRPHLIFYLAGSDPYKEDRFGRLGLTREGLARRDAVVAKTCRARNIPLVLTMSGGYARVVEDIAWIHSESVRIVSESYG